MTKRPKQHRPIKRPPRPAGTIEIFDAAGLIDVLSVGHGHLTITADPADPKSVTEAKAIIASMLARGFALFIENPDGSTSRVKGFRESTFSYLIDDETAQERPARTEAAAAPEGHVVKPARRAPRKRVPVSGTTAVAVGRTAGG